MQPADRVDFVQALNGLAALKPGGNLTKEAIDLYWESMRGDWTLQDFKAAASHLVKSSEFMPTPFHFEQLRKAGEPTPDEAWDLVLSGQPLEPNSRAIRAARTLGGQQHIRRLDIERDLPHARRNFIAAYKDLSDVDPVRDELPQVAAVGARKALRGPAPLANFLPKLGRPETEKARVPGGTQ